MRSRVAIVNGNEKDIQDKINQRLITLDGLAIVNDVKVIAQTPRFFIATILYTLEEKK